MFLIFKLYKYIILLSDVILFIITIITIKYVICYLLFNTIQ